jgi:hypothetical protein
MNCAGLCRFSGSCLIRQPHVCNAAMALLKVSLRFSQGRTIINSFSLSLLRISPMSQTEHQTVSVTDDKANLQGNITLPLIANPTRFHHLCVDTALNPAQMAPLANQEPKSKFTDSSTPLFVMSCDLTDSHKKKAENWIASIDHVIIFVRTSFLFSIPLHWNSSSPYDR